VTPSERSIKLLADDPKADDPKGVERILSAALGCFANQGFHATSVRDIARVSEMSVANLYYHFPSKVEILAYLVVNAVREQIDIASRTLERMPDDPASRLGALVHVHVHRNAKYQAETFVANAELRSLDASNQLSFINIRDELQRMFDQAVLDGVAQGVFICPFPLEASRAIVTMCTAVAGWYKKGGPLSPTALADQYVLFALTMLRCDPDVVARVQMLVAQNIRRGARRR
jgi:AcrR family transcriptional regulator